MQHKVFIPRDLSSKDHDFSSPETIGDTKTSDLLTAPKGGHTASQIKQVIDCSWWPWHR